MRKLSLAIAALCVALSASVYADLDGALKTITLDGSLADWTSGDILYDDSEITDGAPDNSTYTNVYVANDAANLYIGLDTKGTGGGDIANTWTRNVYMDTDGNTGTGFNAGWMANGYDRLIQYGASGASYSVFEFSGATQADWGWTFLGLIPYSYSDDIVELSVPLSSLGIVGNSLVIELNVSGTGVTAETWAGDPESSAETYTVAVPMLKTIAVDGSLSDWSEGDIFYTDAEITDGLPENSTYTNVYVANDAANLYIGLDTKGTGGGTVSNTWTRNVYMDTDGNAGTGFNAGWMANGYDRLIQYGASGTSYSVFEFAGATQADWTWTFLETITYSYSDDIVELSVPLSQLGIVSNSLVIELNVSGTGVTAETWAGDPESTAKTYTVAVPELKTITLDGSLSDWNAGDIFYTDAEITDGLPENSTYTNVYVANDAANLYIGLDTKGTGGGTVSNTWTRNVYMDTDGNAGTGFNAGWMANGYDRLIQYGAGGTSYSVFEFAGTLQGDWTWNWLGLIPYSYSDEIVELSVPLSQLGIADNSLVMEFNVTGTGITTETWASEFESDAKTYNVVTPEPNTLKTITLDGSLADWSNPDDVFYNDSEITDGSPSNSSYEAVYLANDTTNLYVALDTKGTGGGSISNDWWHNIFIDTDMDPNTGYDANWMVNGYDILVEYGNTNGGTSYTVYDFTGAAQGDWSWSAIGNISYAYNDDVAELAIPLSLLGVSGDSIVMELNVAGDAANVPVQTWASEFESGAKTYILAAPDGATPIGSITIANIPGAGVAISWNATASQNYEVVYKNDLVIDPDWLVYTSLVAGSSGEMSVTNPAAATETFYRVETP